MSSVIETRDLTKFFGSLSVVHRLNLDIPVGGIFGLLGPNGAGKSTTIKLITGLLKPHAGTVRIFGLDPKRHRREVFARLGYLPEKPPALPGMTVSNYLAYVGQMYGIPKQEVNQRVLETLDFVNLGKQAEQGSTKLSAGQKQRLGLAAALIHDPELLILDEPSANLDPVARIQLFSKLRKLVADPSKQRTIIISSHILPEIERLADHFAIINQGTLVMEGRLQDMVADLEGVELELTIDPVDAVLALLESDPTVDKVNRLNDRQLIITVTPQNEGNLLQRLPQMVIDTQSQLISLKPVQMPIERAFLKALGNESTWTSR